MMIGQVRTNMEKDQNEKLKIEKSEVTPVNNSCMVSSGRTPKESGPHSFNRAC